MNYVVSGAGAYMDPSQKHFKDVPSGSSKFFFPTSQHDIAIAREGLDKGGMVAAEATKNSMAFVFYTEVGKNVKEIYRFKVAPRLKNDQ